MATIFASPSISCGKPFNPHKNPKTLLPPSISTTTFSSSMPIRLGLTHTIPNSYSNSFIPKKKSSNFNKIRSVAEEEPVTQEDTITNQGEVEPTVSVPVSPSDILTMFFQVFISSIPLVFVCKNYVFIDRLMNACQLFDFCSIYKEQKKNTYFMEVWSCLINLWIAVYWNSVAIEHIPMNVFHVTAFYSSRSWNHNII